MKQKKMLLVFFIFIPVISFIYAQEPNWAKALQLSLYFYDANKCGPGVENGRLEWRGDCHVEDAAVPLTPENTTLSQSFIDQYIDILDPDGDGCIDVSKGYHDAGDHVKFGLPQTYAASTLGWGLFEFKDAFIQIGEYEHILDILKWFTDYFLNCTFIDGNDNVIAFAYMVGEGGTDHTYWGPPELQDPVKIPRPVDFANANNPASDQAAGASAALALMYLNYKDIDSDYADRCLTAAKSLYEFAKTYRALGNGDGFYGSGYDEDELSWACVWLYEATGNTDYIDQIISYDQNGIYTGWIKKIISTTENTWQNIWVHCWDVVWAGIFTRITSVMNRSEFNYIPQIDKDKFDYFSHWNIEYWSGGEVPHANPADTNYLSQSPAGYGMINTWGSARYNTAAQLCALVYNKYKDRPDMVTWAKGQMEYLMGNNPMNRCYEVGYSELSAKHPHHRAAHGSKTNSMLDPVNHKHTLWGALVGGPDGNDVHVDDTADFVYNEVAIDYNAAFVGALAGYYLLFGEGDLPVPDFPPKEAEIDDFFTEAKLEQENTERTQITINIHNESIHPPKFCDGMSVRYYFDLSELYAVGQTIDDVRFEIYYDEQGTSYGGPVQVSEFIPWNFEDGKRIYYVEFDWSGYKIYGDRDFQFALIAAQDSNWQSNWDPSNDWSRQGMTNEMAVTAYIPFYINGELVYGTEPEPGSTSGGGSGGGGTTDAELAVQYKCAEDSVITGQIKPQINIVRKQGTEVVSLSSLKFRYYFTVENPSTQQLSVDYAVVGSSNVTGTFVNVSGNLYYLEVGFTSSAGNLGSQTGEIQLRINKDNWSLYDQSDDYSFNPDITSFIDFNKITLYKDGELIWGIAP